MSRVKTKKVEFLRNFSLNGQEYKEGDKAEFSVITADGLIAKGAVKIEQKPAPSKQDLIPAKVKKGE